MKRLTRVIADAWMVFAALYLIQPFVVIGWRDLWREGLLLSPAPALPFLVLISATGLTIGKRWGWWALVGALVPTSIWLLLSSPSLAVLGLASIIGLALDPPNRWGLRKPPTLPTQERSV